MCIFGSWQLELFCKVNGISADRVDVLALHAVNIAMSFVGVAVSCALFCFVYVRVVVVMWELTGTSDKQIEVVLEIVAVDISMQYRPLFWKLSTLDGFTTSVAELLHLSTIVC